jgi:ring-1,2-phenylacetyl-CoA epoxidase subunit PaaE
VSHRHTANIDAIKRIPDPKEPKPNLALPTFVLFIGALMAWCGSTALAATGLWPWPISTIVNAIAAFALFTVVHDAAHSTLSTIRPINVWIGRVAAFTLNPGIGFRAFRYIHMQHHRFTNHDDGRDPDHYASGGPGWQAPLRWMTMDIAYGHWYGSRIRQRPRSELSEFAVTLVVFAAVVAGLALGGDFLIVGLACWLIPSRLAGFALGWSFDYLPHHGLKHRPTDDRFKTTRNRIGIERLLSPLMLYQNYHLVHHLHPVIPFYRYVAVWRRSEEDYLSHSPALCTVGGRPLSAEEYRALRELSAEHG